MKQYELTVLFHPDLEMNLTPATDKVKKLIEDAGGTITKETSEGKRRMAYSIKGNDFAVYYYYEIDLPATAPAKINSVLGITDEVIRSLLVKVDQRKLKAEAKRATRKASAEASSDGPTDESPEDSADEPSNEAEETITTEEE